MFSGTIFERLEYHKIWVYLVNRAMIDTVTHGAPVTYDKGATTHAIFALLSENYAESCALCVISGKIFDVILSKVVMGLFFKWHQVSTHRKICRACFNNRRGSWVICLAKCTSCRRQRYTEAPILLSNKRLWCSSTALVSAINHWDFVLARLGLCVFLQSYKTY